MNYLLPVQVGAPDMANKTKFNLNKWLSSLRNFTYLSRNYQSSNFPNKNLIKHIFFSAFALKWDIAVSQFYMLSTKNNYIVERIYPQLLIKASSWLSSIRCIGDFSFK